MKNGEGQDFLVCRAAGRLCALPLAHVIETMRPLPLRRLSAAPQFVAGVSVIRGVPTPVLDTGTLLDESTSAPGRLVSVRTGERTVALAFDAVLGIRSILNDSLHRLPPLLDPAGSEVVAAIGALDEELLVVLEGSRLLPAAAWDAIRDQHGAGA